MNTVSASSIVTSAPPTLLAASLYEREPRGAIVRVCAVGDVSLSGRAAQTLRQFGGADLFTEVFPILASSDIVFGNLECTLSANSSEQLMFVAPAEGANILRTAGFSILHLANNHIYDMGPNGLAATMQAVENAGILALGVGNTIEKAQQLIRIDKNGIRIGWLGCGYTHVKQKKIGPRYWEFTEESIVTAASRAKEEVDFLVVSMHKGLMYLDYPAPEDKKLAERLAAVGADLILMHHSHVVQGVQAMPNRGICCYGLGNFLFDAQEGNVKTLIMAQEQNAGAVFFFDLDADGLVRAFALPTWIDEFCRVRWAAGERGVATLKRLMRISLRLNEDYKNEFEQQRIERNVSHALNVLMFHTKRGNLNILLEQLRHIRLKHLRLVMRWAFMMARKLCREKTTFTA